MVETRIFNTPGPRFYFLAAVKGSMARRWSNFYETLDEVYEYVEQIRKYEEDELISSSLCVTDRPHLFPMDEFAPMEECVEIESAPED